ncbi:hypothetical protein VTL71DRAFT_13733 [Oculimacula yallundae]|uniref:Uncharacterized protein n=1 Tax=Oculimacula yallundae TaxID=86028 RepID=A0ABR4CLT4_9HELO
MENNQVRKADCGSFSYRAHAIRGYRKIPLGTVSVSIQIEPLLVTLEKHGGAERRVAPADFSMPKSLMLCDDAIEWLRWRSGETVRRTSGKPPSLHGTNPSKVLGGLSHFDRDLCQGLSQTCLLSRKTGRPCIHHLPSDEIQDVVIFSAALQWTCTLDLPVRIIQSLGRSGAGLKIFGIVGG